MKLIYLEVSKSDIDVPMKCLYIINKTLDNDREFLYNILYGHYGIKKVEVLDELNVKDRNELKELIVNYTGYIDLRGFTKEVNNG